VPLAHFRFTPESRHRLFMSTRPRGMSVLPPEADVTTSTMQVSFGTRRGHSFIRILDQPERAWFLEHFDANALSPLARHRSSRIEIMDLD
jgi:hypothetical protein